MSQSYLQLKWRFTSLLFIGLLTQSCAPCCLPILKSNKSTVDKVEITSLALEGNDHQQFQVVEEGQISCASSFNIEDYKGKVVVLNFWATYCLPCITEIPELTKLYQHFDPKEVAVLGIAVDRGAVDFIQSKLDLFIKQHKIDYPIFLDHELDLVRHYGDFKQVPVTFLIDQTGKIDLVYTEAVHFKEVAKAIQILLQRS